MANISYGVNILPKTNNAYALGNSDYRWSNIYTVQINGTNVSDLGAVQDVQIDSTSILNNGVANIPLMSDSTIGVAKADSAYGIYRRTTDNLLVINSANETIIKAGTSSYRPITPAVQNVSVFYGLAKAAGDSTQAASSNAVGAYTDNAKIQIQKMLGIYEPPFVLLNDITLEERTSVSLTADDNNTPYNLRNVFMEIKYPANLVSESSGYDRWQFHNSNSDFLNCETDRYTTNSVQCFKRLWTERKGNLILAYYSRQANTGGYGATYYKDHITGSRGAKFDFGNITAIKMNTDDYEPVGTQIKIWGQWAY